MILVFENGKELMTTPEFNGNLVTIRDSKPNTSGFVVKNKGVVIFSALDYKTVYEKGKGFYTLSNDGSVKPTPVPPEPPVPTYTEATLYSGDESAELELIDFVNAGDISFYAPVSIDADFLEGLTSIEVGEEEIDLTDGYTFSDIKETTMYELPLYYVAYHKYTEQELINMQVEINTANIDYVAMETGVELDTEV